MRAVPRYLLPCMLALVAACRSTSLGEMQRLAESPPLSYSVLVSGGAFISGDTAGAETIPQGESLLARTWPKELVGKEAFPLDSVVEALESGRVFVRTVRDGSESSKRATISAMPDVAPLDDEPLQGFLRDARAEGHDFVLVIEQLRNGRVEQQGVNDQWPITAATWLLVGLGLLIPDHTYESRASLRVTLRELQTGQIVYDSPLAGGPVDLAMWERASLFGMLTSIVIPPFWVADDEDTVARHVRELSARRLIASLARQMKSFELQERLRERSAARIEVRKEGDLLRVLIDAKENLGVVRLRVDLQSFEGPAAQEFERQLLASETARDGIWRYTAACGPLSGKLLQVLVQTVAGRVASVTVPLDVRQ